MAGVHHLGRKIYPKLDVTIGGPNFNVYWTTVKSRLSGSNLRRLLAAVSARASEFVARLVLSDALIKKYKLITSTLDKSILKGMTADGAIRAIPYGAGPIVLYNNVDALERVWLQLPGTTYSREQLLADAKKLMTDDNKAPTIEPSLFLPKVWAIAGGVEAVKNGELDRTNSELVDQMQCYLDLVNKEEITAVPNVTHASDVTQSALTGGNVDMLIAGPWTNGTFASAAKFPTCVTVVPSTSGKAHGMTACSGFGIAKNYKGPDGAFKAIQAMSDISVFETQAVKRGIVPSCADAQLARTDGKTPEAPAAVQALGNAIALLTISTWKQVDTLFIQHGAEGYRDDKISKDVLNTIQQSMGQ